MASPVVPSEFLALVPDPTSSKCSGFVKALLQLPSKLYQFINWILDSDGNFNRGFLRGIRKPGEVFMSASPIAEDASQLLCNGQEVVRADFPELFAAISTTYGTPTSGLVFKLPNLTARFPVGVGAFESTATVALGGTGGEEKHTLLTAELAAHGHKLFVGGSDGADHGLYESLQTDDDHGGGAGYEQSYETGVGDDPYVQNTGSDTPHNNLPPYIGLYFYIAT